MSALGNATFKRSADRPAESDLLGPVVPARKSASHGEAGYARNARDAYFTEPWVTRALLAEVDFRTSGDPLHDDVIWEPAVGDGRMATELVRAGYAVVVSDIHDYGWPGTRIIDFVRHTALDRDFGGFSGIITNPPFDLAREFIEGAPVIRWLEDAA
jgi:hypothetical protein